MSAPINGDMMWSRLLELCEQYGLGKPISFPDLVEKIEKRLSPSSAVAESAAVAALRELVTLKDMHDRIARLMPKCLSEPRNYRAEEMDDEYKRRKPLAWEAARRVLSTQSSTGAPGWISMKERQPADFERVLCVNSNGYTAVANRFHDTGMGTWNGSDYTAEEHTELVIGDITHWMPLPALPSATGETDK